MNETHAPSPAAAPSVRYLDITADQAGQRIDNFLTTHIKGVPRSHLYRLLRRGEVRVNKGRVGPDYRICAGDRLRIPPVRQSETTAPTQPSKNLLTLLEGCILHEDSHLLVLNKPAGLAVHGGSGLHFGVIEAMRALRPNAPCMELVHRLDRDTSGLLMIAKRRSRLRQLHTLLREGKIDKRYRALVRGTWAGGMRTVDAPLVLHQLQSGERMVRVDHTGKESITRLTALARYSSAGVQASFIEAQLITGRTHQIRVHTAHIGHPVAGDEKYGDADFNRAARAFGLHRLFLHAHQLTINEEGQTLSWEAPLEPSLQRVLATLQGTSFTGETRSR